MRRIYSSRKDCQRFSYLNEMIRQIESEFKAGREIGQGKRMNWLKFCHRCGKDILTSARYVKLCPECRQKSLDN
jgi:membrane protease subunit (stomatin/prohibitin family)